MNMAREEAVRNFREHWASLAITGVDKDHKDDYLKRHGYSGIQDNCFLCEFTDRHCKECPVEWPVTQKDGVFPCCNSYFWDWVEAKSPEERKRLASIIRDLPERSEKKEPAPDFKVGDKVRLKEGLAVGQVYGRLALYPRMAEELKGKTATIGAITTEGNFKLKEFCYFWSPEMLELLPPLNHCPEPKTIQEFGATFIFNGPVTVCIIDVDGRKFKGIAKCSPEDTWDESVGKGWAGLRAMQKILKATEKNLKRNAAQAAGR